MAKLVFGITQKADGGYCGKCLTLDIFAQADTLDELMANVREAVRAYFFDRALPERIRLHLVCNEVIRGRERSERL
jgi:predicted RNase H-like HicB family nuclease